MIIRFVTWVLLGVLALVAIFNSGGMETETGEMIANWDLYIPVSITIIAILATLNCIQFIEDIDAL